MQTNYSASLTGRWQIASFSVIIMLTDSLFPGLALPRLSCILYHLPHEMFRLRHCRSGASLHQTLYRAAVDKIRMWEYCATLVVLSLDLSTSLADFAIFPAASAFPFDCA